MSKGSNPRPFSVSQETFNDNRSKIFSDEVKPGRYKIDAETGELISSQQWHAKYGRKRVRTHFVVADIDPYISPMTEGVINSRREHRYDLEKHGCRVYEGRDQESKETERFHAEKDAKLEKSLEHCVNETYYELRDKTVESAGNKPIAWTFGE